MVDDAHGFGVRGRNGGGIVEELGLSLDEVPILIGTLGKAFGTFGAFVAGSETLIETLIQFGRTYIYTTALPPAVAAATRASLRLLRDEDWRREHLRALIARFRTRAAALGIPLLPSTTPIQPVPVGDDGRVLAMAERLREAGHWVGAIRPPTVPRGTARLRIALSAAHSAAQVDALVDALAVAWRALPADRTKPQSGEAPETAGECCSLPPSLPKLGAPTNLEIDDVGLQGTGSGHAVRPRGGAGFSRAVAASARLRRDECRTGAGHIRGGCQAL
jgi:hypothetical protein